MTTHTFSWTTAISVAFAFGFLDFVWGQYNMAFIKHDKIRATISSGIIVALGGIALLAYVEDHIYLIPATIGAMIGTYITMCITKPGTE